MATGPADNDWNPGGGTLGLWPAAWIPCHPYDTDPSWNTGYGGGTGFSKTFSTNPTLFDAYHSTGGIANWNQPPTPGVFSTPTNGHYGALYFETAELGETYAEGNWWTSHPTGQVGVISEDVAPMGIGARIRGGTLSGTGTLTNSYVTGLDGYWFICNHIAFGSPPQKFRFQLIRVNGGTVTKLTETPGATTSTDGNTVAVLQSGRPLRLSIQVNGTGATVSVVCRVTYWYTSAYTTGGEPIEVINYNDTDAGRITGTGRVGFFQHPGYKRISSGVVSVPSNGYIRAKEIGSPWAINERWRQRYAGDAFAVSSTNTGATKVGLSLQSGFSGDWHATLAQRGSVVYGTAPVTGSNALEFDYANLPSSTGQKTCLQAREADDPVNQDRTVDYYFDNTGTPDTDIDEPGKRSVSIFLRESGANVTFNKVTRCYRVEIAKWDTGGTNPELYVYRHENASTVAQIARKTNPSGGFSDATWHTLRVKVEAVQGATHNDAAKITIWINGTQETGITNTASGVSIDADDSVVDDASSRITEGGGEGFRVKVATIAGAHKTYIDDWGQGTIVDNEGTPENEQASIALGAETDGATGTLTLPAEWGIEETSEWNTAEHEFEYPWYRQGTATQGRARRTWRTKSSALKDAAEEASLVGFWDSHGMDVPFTWTPPGDASSITAHFVTDLTRTLQNPGVRGFEVEIEELF